MKLKYETQTSYERCNECDVRGPCIVSIFQYVSNKMQRYTVYLYMETVLHVSGGISTHHKEHTQLYLQYLVLVKPLLLPAAIVEALGPSVV